MSSEKSRRVAKNTGFMFVRMMIIVLVGLFTSREVLRILGVSDFGVYNLVGTIVVMFSFLQNALNNATTRFITYGIGTGDTGGLGKTFAMSVNTEAILAFTILICSEAVGPWFISNKLNIPEGRIHAANIVFQLSLLHFLIGVMRTPFNSAIIAHERFNFFAYTSIIEAVGKLAVVYLLVISDADKLILYAALLAAVSLTILLWMAVYCYKHFPETRYKFYWDGRMLRKFTNYSGWSMIVNVADIAVTQSISIFFNIFSGVVANAALGVSNQVNSYLNQFLGNFSQSYNPQIVKSYAAGDRDYFMNLLHTASKISYFLLFGVAFPFMLNADYILGLWLAEVPPMTSSFLALMICHSLLDSFSQPLWASVHATGNLKVHQLLMGGIKVLNIPVSYLLLRQGFPVITVLMVYVSLNLACTVVRIWWLTHLIRLDGKRYCKEVIWNIVKVTLMSVPLPLALSFLDIGGLASLCLTTATFFTVYGCVIYKSALNGKEKQIVAEYAGRAKAKVRAMF